MKKIGLLVIVISLGLITISINQVEKTNQSKQQELLENALRQAVIQCYAIEGAYPTDVKYLEDHYGLQINEEEYIIHYESIATNIMPDIAVIKR